MEVIESRTGRIPSCQISTKLIKDLAETMRNGSLQVQQQLERSLPKKDARSLSSILGDAEEQYKLKALDRFLVKISSPLRTISCSSVESLANLELPIGVTSIKIEAGALDYGYHAEVEFNFRHPSDSGYSIEGHDGQILNGVAKTLEQKFEEHQTHHGIAHKIGLQLLTGTIFGVLIVWMIIKIILWAGLPVYPWISVPLTLIWTSLAYWAASTLKWLFPFFSYERDKKGNIRNIIMGLLGALTVALFANVLYDLVRLLFSH